MKQKNFLRETANLLYMTNENLEYAISRLQDCDISLFKEIHATLVNIENIFRGEAKQREELEKKCNLEKACKEQAYFFILKNGYVNEFCDFIRKAPLEEFK